MVSLIINPLTIKTVANFLLNLIHLDVKPTIQSNQKIARKSKTKDQKNKQNNKRLVDSNLNDICPNLQVKVGIFIQHWKRYLVEKDLSYGFYNLRKDWISEMEKELKQLIKEAIDIYLLLDPAHQKRLKNYCLILLM